MVSAGAIEVIWGSLRWVLLVAIEYLMLLRTFWSFTGFFFFSMLFINLIRSLWGLSSPYTTISSSLLGLWDASIFGLEIVFPEFFFLRLTVEDWLIFWSSLRIGTFSNPSYIRGSSCGGEGTKEYFFQWTLGGRKFMLLLALKILVCTVRSAKSAFAPFCFRSSSCSLSISSALISFVFMID